MDNQQKGEPKVEQPAIIRPNDSIVAWTAPEYIHSKKNGFWIITIILAVLVLLAISVYFRAWSFTVLIGVGVFAAVVHLTSKPKNINYSLSSETLKINDREYSLDTFKGFGIQEDDQKQAFSIVLEPVKKLAGNVIIYFPEGSGEEIVDILSGVMPMEDIKPDLLDRLLGLLHF